MSLTHPHFRLALRIALATIGGYALCWALFVLLCAWLPFQKVTVWFFVGQLAPLPFLAVLLAAFAVDSLLCIAGWTFGLALLCFGLGRWV